MFKLNLKIAFRNLLKYKSYSLINMMGLSIGMASCILIFIFIQYQLSFDKGYKNEDRIIRFVTDWTYNSFVDYSAGSPIPFAAAAREELPELEHVANIIKNGGVVTVKDDEGKERIKANQQVYFAEPGIFDIFEMQWIGGNPAEGFSAPNTAVLSEKTAIAFYGSAEKAMGKSFTFWNEIELKVIGVYKNLPENTSNPFNIIISFETSYLRKNKSWDSVSSMYQCFALIKKGVDITALQTSLDRFNKVHFRDKKIAGNQTSLIQSIKDIHFSDRYTNFADTSNSMKEIYGLAIIGLFLMITACINFINLATAQSVNRSKEVGVRKVMGSGRKQLIVQFLTETLTITLLSLLLACVLSELALPVLQNLFKGKVSFSIFGNPVIFLFMGILVVFVSFLAGFYPAMILSGFSPALAIKNKVTVNAGSLSMRKVLVVMQFAITIILIISTLVIMKQLQYVREKPLGFDAEAITMINMPGDSLSRTRFDLFKNKVLQIPGVKLLSYSTRAPLSDNMSSTNFEFNGQENKDFEVTLNFTDQDYFKLYGIKLVAGKIFAKSDTANGYLANETFVKKVGLPNAEAAIGKIIIQNGIKGPIIGVLKDFNDKPLRESISPMICYQDKNNYYMAAIQLDQQQILPAMGEIEKLWTSFYPNEIYSAKFLNEDINSYYQSEQMTGFLFKVFAGVIIFISFIGLFGLISFVATQRTKEIAIRKVLGASTLELVKMLNGSFMMMVFIANLAAWPLAYIFVSKWLSSFAYRMDLSIWPFIFAMCISMIITLVTVSVRSYRAAVANTVDALKYE